jgi:hypothetical protein
MSGENGISHAGRFHRRFHIVRAQDMCAFENQGGVSGEICVEPVDYWSILSVLRQGAAE